MSQSFQSRLKEGPLLLDGAMGTLLYARGASIDYPFEGLNLHQKDLVQQVHIDYINAGSDIIETNSFAGNRFKLAQSRLASEVSNINIWAAKIARNAREIAGVPVLIAGSVGPTGKLLSPLGDAKPKDLEDAYKEQMEGLLAGGVDLFIIETMSSLDELAIAIKTAKSLSHLPVIAQLTFSVEGQTFFGLVPEDIVYLFDKLENKFPDVVGINCGAGPGPSLDYLNRMIAAVSKSQYARSDLYFSCLPNAGLPAKVGDRFLYASSPDYCASFVEPFAQAGAKLIGGCCGTTPEHTAAMRRELDRYLQDLHTKDKQKLDSSNPVETGASVEVVSESSTRSIQLHTKELPGIASRLKPPGSKEFFISVELDPPKGTVTKKIITAAENLYKAGADAINVGDSPMARVRMSSLVTCHLIKQQVGIDTIIHFTTRDRNLMGIQSDLLGCQALGITNILALTGDPPSVGTYAHATAVYDVDSIGLIGTIRQLNLGNDIAGNSIGSPTTLSIACALSPNHENRKLEIDRFKRKIEAGAHYAMTQPIYQISDLTNFLDEFGKCPIPILVGIMPLHSFKHAEYLHNEVPGISIPLPIRKAMEKAGDNGQEMGIELTRELLKEVKKIASGIYIVPSFGRYDEICELVKELKGFIER